MELNSQLHKQIQERERTIAELQTKALEVCEISAVTSEVHT